MNPTILVVIALALSTANGFRIKIRLEKESIERFERHVFKRQDVATACSDIVEVERSTLTLPGRLDELDDRVRFYRSDIATNNLDSFQNMTRVPLLNRENPYLRDVLDRLRDDGCLPFFWGGAVRDQFLGTPPNDADVEIDCSIDEFYTACVAAWGEENCERSSGRPLGHIGQSTDELPNVDLASTDITFYVPLARLEFTANSLAYDLNGNAVIIDIPGTGRFDLCTSPPGVRIPSDDDSLASWQEWNGPNGTSGSALLRFWKLRSRGFGPYSDATRNFIVSQSILLLADEPDEFGDFYCGEVYDSDYVASSYCDVAADVCTNKADKKMDFDEVFEEDFGDYWTNTIVPDLLPTCGSGAVQLGFQVSMLGALLLIAILL